MKIKPIKKELRGLLTEFLEYEEYQELFSKFAKVAGYHGTNKARITSVLFTPNENAEIVFTVDGLYDLFTEYQLIRQLIDKEPYKSLLLDYPEAIRNIRIVAKKILNKEDLTEADLSLIFNTDTYDTIRKVAEEASEDTQPNDK